MTMEAESIDRIRDLAQDAQSVELVEVGGATYTPRNLKRVEPGEYKPDALVLTSLRGLVDYLELKLDELPEKSVVHVVSPHRVEVVTGVIGVKRERLLFAAADCSQLQITGSRLDPSEMTIRLRTRCAPGGDLDEVVRVLGNVTADESVKVEDDGFSQEVSARRGIQLVGKEKVPNPVSLAPFRTFREVEQPESPFLLRVYGGGDSGAIGCELFEADGGAWEIEAVSRIVDWLHEADLPLSIIS